MENAEKYEMDFFGQKFIFATNDGNRNDLEKVINYYKKLTDSLLKKMPDRSHLDIAILAGLKITDKLYSIVKEKDGNLNEDDDKIHDILNDIIRRLDISLRM